MASRDIQEYLNSGEATNINLGGVTTDDEVTIVEDKVAFKGTTTPNNTYGQDGDLYSQYGTEERIWKKTAGMWQDITPNDGIVGPIGPEGPQGVQGPQGVVGSEGPQGQRGIRGVKGDTGNTGTDGADGSNGVQGVAGDQGQQGSQGVAGIQGYPGPQGPDGEDGQDGDAGAGIIIVGIDTYYDIMTTEGVAGDIWLVNETGGTIPDDYKENDAFVSNGLGAGPANWTNIGPIVGPKGETGNTGPSGPAGIQGPQGNDGIQGAQGQIGQQGAKGVDGADGSDSTVPGPIGPQGDTGADSTVAGPQGVPGQTGAQGSVGPIGPQGIQGIAGPIGPIGPQGSDGIQGPIGPEGPSIWGVINGTLSDQTDLQAALDSKLDDVVAGTNVSIDKTDAANPIISSTDTIYDSSDVDVHMADTTGNPHAVNKDMVGLDSVDNTSDADKPVSTATQTALDLKADGTDLTAHENNTGNPHAVTKAQVGLSVANNTADADKPVSTATQTALDLKTDDSVFTAHETSTLNPHVVTKTQVGLDQVDNTSDTDKPVSTETQTALDLKVDDTEFTAHLNDNANPHVVTKTQVGLSNVNNTSDINKPVSFAGQTALDLKADVTALTAHTGSTTNPHVVTKTQVGLSEVDNTTDVNKPVSTAAQTEIETRIIWRGIWVSAEYNKNDLVRDGAWTTIANKTTTTRPAPQPNGDPVFSLKDIPLWNTLQNVSSVHSGQTYTFTQAGWVKSLRVWLPEVTATTDYRFIVADITDPANPLVRTDETTSIFADGWVDIAMGMNLILAGTILKLTIEAINTGSETTATGGWIYEGKDNNNLPLFNGWNTNSQETLLRIHNTDLDSVDRTTELAGVIPESTFQFVQTNNPDRSITFRVVGAPDLSAPGFTQYVVTRISSGAIGIPLVSEATNTEITVPVAQATQYVEETNTWAISPSFATVVGFLEFDGVSEAGKETNAYGFDLQFQHAEVSGDWDLVATSESGSGGSSSSPTLDVIDNLVSTDPFAALSANQGRVLDEKIIATTYATFTSLQDTPVDYTDAADKMLSINQAGDAIEFTPKSSKVTEAKPTGLSDGGELNIVNGGLDIEVIAGQGVIIDSFTVPSAVPTSISLSWNTLQAPIVTVAPTAGETVHFTLADSGSVGPIVNTNLALLKQYAVTPSPSVARDEVYLGYAIFNGTTWGEISAPVVVNNAAASLTEFVKMVIGPSFTQGGGKVTESGVFELDREAGVVWEMNRNWHVNKKDPHRESFAEVLALPFRYTNRDFTVVSAETTLMDPSMYDDGTGVVAVPGNSVATTIQRLYIDQRDNFWIMYGQNLLDNFDTAIASIGIDHANTDVPMLLGNSILLGYIVAEKTRSEWAEGRARFISVIEATGGSGATASASTFLELTDTPTDYTGHAEQVPTVSADELGLVFKVPTVDWGNVGGSLENQADLIGSLDGKNEIISGFENSADAAISFNYGTKELTLAPVGAEYTVFTYSVKKVVTASKTITCTLTTESVLIVLDSASNLVEIEEAIFDLDQAIKFNTAVVARILKDPATGNIVHVSDLRYPYDMAASTRESFININGASYINGLALENILADQDGTSDTHLQFSVEDGIIALANHSHATANTSQVLSPIAEIPILYRLNTAGKISAATSLPIITNGSVGTDYAGERIAYNPVTGTIGDLVEAPNDTYVSYHYFASVGLDYPIVGVAGDTYYPTAEDARNGALAEVAFMLRRTPSYEYFTPIGSVIFHTLDSYTNSGKAVIVKPTADEDYSDSRESKTGIVGSLTASGTFHQDNFNVHNDDNTQLRFNMENVEIAGKENVVVELKPYEDVDFRLVPQYKLSTIASTSLAEFAEVSLDINGQAQAYPATGGEGASEFTTRNVELHEMVFIAGNVGIVIYTDATADTIFYKPGAAQSNGSIVWGTEAVIPTAGNVISISTCQIDSTYVAVAWVTASGYFHTHILNSDGITVSSGSQYLPRDSNNVISGGIAYASGEHHIVWAWIETDGNVYNNYGKISNGNQLDTNDYNAINMTPASVPSKIEVRSEGDNIVIAMITETYSCYWREASWYKPTFGTGRYDDLTNSLSFVIAAERLAGFSVINRTLISQVEISPGVFKTFSATYSPGGSISQYNSTPGTLLGEAATTMQSASGLRYSVVRNTVDKYEIWEQGTSPSSDYNKLYTSTATIPSNTAVTQLVAVIFGATYALMMNGDTVNKNDITFIDSSATRTDNYIGNAKTAVVAGETVEILLGLPIINHSITYAPGDVFFLGPYKYQAITPHQVVMIVENTIFP